MEYLVTGASGFIGSRVIEALNAKGHKVVGIDNNNDYYDINLKYARLKRIENDNFKFIEMDFSDKKTLDILFEDNQFDRVIHLGAQAGVRYSIENPHAYIDSNVKGFLDIL